MGANNGVRERLGRAQSKRSLSPAGPQLALRVTASFCTTPRQQPPTDSAPSAQPEVTGPGPAQPVLRSEACPPSLLSRVRLRGAEAPGAVAESTVGQACSARYASMVCRFA